MTVAASQKAIARPNARRSPAEDPDILFGVYAMDVRASRSMMASEPP